MTAAAKSLTPVVLELSGKSPVFVDRDANIEGDYGGPVRSGTNVEVAGRGLVLAPTLFSRAANTLIEPGTSPLLIHPARGRATMAENLDPPPATRHPPPGAATSARRPRIRPAGRGPYPGTPTGVRLGFLEGVSVGRQGELPTL